VDQTERQTGEAVVEKTRPKTAQPPMFRVLLHNDDYTTMEFVVDVLESIFHKSPAEAHRLMMQVHREGSSVCGVYPHEIAETKVSLVHERAKAHGFPLRASIEEV
jgi:ATP-dependent Clp protease adaptor protein ClpS